MTGRDLFDRRMKALAEGDVEAALEQYADDAQVVRFIGVATGKDEIRAYLTGYLAAYRRFDLVSLDQFREAGDAVLWAATVDTEVGAAQIYDTVILDENGKIIREFPGLHGYWGRT